MDSLKKMDSLEMQDTFLFLKVKLMMAFCYLSLKDLEKTHAIIEGKWLKRNQNKFIVE